MPVNDKIVESLVKKAIAKYKGRTMFVVGDLAAALGDIIEQRHGKCGNLEYAAADHYLNMRAYTALLGYAGALTAIPLILAYDAAKYVDLGMKELVGRKLMPSTDGDPCPPTDPDWSVTQWAYKGVLHGLADYELW